MSWSVILTVALKVLSFIIDRLHKKSSEDKIELTEKQQEHYTNVVNKINQDIAVANTKFATTDSVRERAEQINKTVDS